MYFGSVKFFKQLIYSSVICTAAAMAAYALLFGIKCSAASSNSVAASVSRKQAKASEHMVSADTLNVPDGTTLEQIYLALAAKGYTDKDIIDFFADNNSEELERYVMSRAEALGTALDINAGAPIYEYDSGYDPSEFFGVFPAVYPEIEDLVFSDSENKVFIAFRGSPSDNTGELLDVLDAFNIKALFFVSAEDDRDLISEIYERGHTLGIYCREYDGMTDIKEYFASAADTFDVIKEITGKTPQLFTSDGHCPEAVSGELLRRGFDYCGGASDLSAGYSDEEFVAALENEIAVFGHASVMSDCPETGGRQAAEMISRILNCGFETGIPH